MGARNCRRPAIRRQDTRRPPHAFAAVLSSFPVGPFPPPAHRTGRADLPHPALSRDHAFAHGRCRVVNARRVRRISPTAIGWKIARIFLISPCASGRTTVAAAGPRTYPQPRRPD